MRESTGRRVWFFIRGSDPTREESIMIIRGSDPTGEESIMKEPARINRRTAILVLLTILAVAAPNSLGSSLQLYDVSESNSGGFTGLDFWHSSQIYVLGTPNVFYNGSASDYINGTVHIPAHTAGFHPGPDGEYSVFRWTAPAAGTYDLSAAFRGDDFVFPTSTDVHILLDGVSLFSGGVYVFGPAVSFWGFLHIPPKRYIPAIRRPGRAGLGSGPIPG